MGSTDSAVRIDCEHCREQTAVPVEELRKHLAEWYPDGEGDRLSLVAHKHQLEQLAGRQATDSHLWAEATAAEVQLALREVHALIERDQETLDQVRKLKVEELRRRLRRVPWRVWWNDRVRAGRAAGERWRSRRV